MGPELYFTALVFGIGVLELIWRASAGIGKKLGYTEQSQLDRAGKSPQRGDWYVFFHRSDLLGPEADGAGNISATTSRASDATRKRRQENRRPVARARFS